MRYVLRPDRPSKPAAGDLLSAAPDRVKDTTIGIDATTLEANAALRSIVRRDSGETYQEFLTRLAQGIVNLLRAARSCPVTSTLPTVFSRRTSPHPIQRTRGCGAGGGEPTAGGVD